MVSNQSLQLGMDGTHRQVVEVGEVVVDDVSLGRTRRGAYPSGLEARVVRPHALHRTPVRTSKWEKCAWRSDLGGLLIATRYGLSRCIAE